MVFSKQDNIFNYQECLNAPEVHLESKTQEAIIPANGNVNHPPERNNELRYTTDAIRYPAL